MYASDMIWWYRTMSLLLGDQRRTDPPCHSEYRNTDSTGEATFSFSRLLKCRFMNLWRTSKVTCVDLRANGMFLSTGSRDGETPNPLVHQIYDYNYCFHAFKGLQVQYHAKLRECDPRRSY
jgi:hypothetical protein